MTKLLIVLLTIIVGLLVAYIISFTPISCWAKGFIVGGVVYIFYFNIIRLAE